MNDVNGERACEFTDADLSMMVGEVDNLRQAGESTKAAELEEFIGQALGYSNTINKLVTPADSRDPFNDTATLELLKVSLSAAVPLWAWQLQQQPWEYLSRRSGECAQIVAEKGDVILYRGKKRGDTAQAFNALAEGVAILSFCPGGVKLFGLHFDNTYDGYEVFGR